jgi:ATP-dependent Lon protease
MQLSNYGDFPAKLPIIVEDELFLYPFMISPIFLTDKQNIEAANIALEDNSLVIVISAKNSHE